MQRMHQFFLPLREEAFRKACRKYLIVIYLRCSFRVGFYTTLQAVRNNYSAISTDDALVEWRRERIGLWNEALMDMLVVWKSILLCGSSLGSGENSNISLKIYAHEILFM